jgi:hypothetical protein
VNWKHFSAAPLALSELLSPVLGLEDLTLAGARLAEARKVREATLSGRRVLARLEAADASVPRHAGPRWPGAPGTSPPPGRRRPAPRRRARPLSVAIELAHVRWHSQQGPDEIANVPALCAPPLSLRPGVLGITEDRASACPACT